MTPTLRPPFWTPANALGFVAFLAGLGFLAWSKADGSLTWPALTIGALLCGGGMYFVDASRAHAFVAEVRDVAATVQQARGGQLNVAQPADTSVVVERPAAPDVVVPPQADPVVMRDRAAPVDRLAYNTTDRIPLTARPAIPTPTAGAPKRRGRRATDTPVSATDVTQPIAIPPADVPEDEGVL